MQSPLVERQLTQLLHGSHWVALLVVLKVLGSQGVQVVLLAKNCPGEHCWKEPWTSKATKMAVSDKLKLCID